MIRLSAVIITLDAERTIDRCLASLDGVADEIVVLDSGSSDRTRELCAARGARVAVHPFDGFTAQKNRALDLAAHDHVLSLDADEALSPELAASVLAAKAGWAADGYAVNRLNFYGDRPIRSCGWYPDRKVRLWDRRRGRWAGGLVHETVALAPGARLGRLEGDLLHAAYERAGQLLAKAQAYSDAWARERAFRRRVGPAGIAAKTVAAFLRSYLLRGGIRDGYEGLVISAGIATGVLFNHAKLLEANRSVRTSLVVTTYNRPDALALTLRSALRQSEPPAEILVADDGSTDETRRLVAAIAAEAPIPVRHAWQADDGFRAAESRNRAIAAATGELIVMVDGDLVLHRDFLRDHRRAARRGRFVQGSRVILSAPVTRAAIAAGRIDLGPLAPGTRNRKNALRIPWLSRLVSRRSRDVYRVRSVNMSFWRDDVLRVNGFDEEFVGWGREDSEFAARLQHAGVERLHLRFAAVGFHLWHPEAPRAQLERNQARLERTLATRAVRCERGIDRHLPPPA